MECNLIVNGQFKHQNEAIKTGRAFAIDIHPRSGAKRFITIGCSVSHSQHHTCSDKYLATFLLKSDRHMYEILLDHTPTRLFLDLDRPWGEGPICLNELIAEVNSFVKHASQFVRVAVLQAHQPNIKYSYHVIFPDAVFDCVNADMKQFVLLLIEVVKKTKKFTYLNKHGELVTDIDSRVYTRNRNFRLMGQSKLSATDYPLLFNSIMSTAEPWETILQSQLATTIGTPFLQSLLQPAKEHLSFALSLKKNIPTTKRILTRSIDAATLLEITCDQDIANALDARKLRQIDFVEVFLPVLSSLCTSRQLTNEYLQQWVDFSDPIKSHNIVKYAKAHSKDVSSCAFALKFLRQNVCEVTDRRIGELRQKVYDIDERYRFPTEKNGWIVLNDTKNLQDCLQRAISRDGRYINTPSERRRLFRIMKKSRVGETARVLKFAAAQLGKKRAETVMYIAPRQHMVIQAARIAERRLRYCQNFKIYVYYHNSKDKLESHLIGHTKDRVFASACIGSLNCLPEKADFLILDGLRACVDFTLQSGGTEVLLSGLIRRMREARNTILLEADMTPALVTAFTRMWRWRQEPFPATKKWQKWRREKKHRWKGSTSCYSSSGNRSVIEMPPVDIALLPPFDPLTTLSRIEEYETFISLSECLLDTLHKKGKRVVAYVSTQRIAQWLDGLIQKARWVTAPRHVYIMTSPSDLEEQLFYLQKTHCVIVTSAFHLSPTLGRNIIFDEAYLFLEMSPSMPRVNTMAQLTAFIPSLQERVLKFAVRTKFYHDPTTCKDVSQVLYNQILKIDPSLESLCLYHKFLCKSQSTQIRDKTYCTVSLRADLASVHSTYLSGEYIVPKHLFVSAKPVTG